MQNKPFVIAVAAIGLVIVACSRPTTTPAPETKEIIETPVAPAAPKAAFTTETLGTVNYCDIIKIVYNDKVYILATNTPEMRDFPLACNLTDIGQYSK